MGVVGSVAAACLVGCETDTGRADKQLRVDLAAASAAVNPGSSETVGLLERAAGQSGSPGYRAAAKGALAVAELNRLHPSMVEHASKQQQIQDRLFEIKQLAINIATANILMEGYRALDPATSVEAINSKIGDARGKNGAEAWIAEEPTNIASLTTLTQRGATLSTDITSREDQIEKLKADRQLAFDEGDEAFAKSENATGRESVDQFNRGVAARKRAAELSVEIDRADFELLPLRQDLELTKAEMQVIQGVVGDPGGQSVGSLQEQLKEVEARWASVELKIDEQKKLVDGYVARIAELSGAGADATFKFGDEDRDSLAKLIADDQKLIESGSTTLNNVNTHYEDAVKAAEDYSRTLKEQLNVIAPEARKSPPAVGIDLTMKAFNTNGYKIQQAHALATAAQLAMDEVSTLQRRADVVRLLTNVSEKAEIDLPAGLTDASAATLEAAKSKADATFEAAKQKFVDVTEAALSLPEHQKSAIAGLMFLNYQWSQYGQIIGDRELTRSKLDDAIEQKRQYVDEKGGVLGANLPSEIAGTYTPSTGSPDGASTDGAAPETAPATIPAPGGGELMPATPAPAPEADAPAPDTKAPAVEKPDAEAPADAPVPEDQPAAPEGGMNDNK